MGRGPKFSFPIPGRKSKVERDSDDTHSSRNTPHTQWSPRADVSTPYSKAERLLGTAGLPFRPSSKSQTSLPMGAGFMTVTVSEASFESERASSMAADEGSLAPPRRPGLSNRPSSQILPNVYENEDRRGSQSSNTSRRVLPQTSNSTIRSYYDPHKSPLSVSQQTSASAVRDMALRKGKPTVAAHQDEDHVLGPSSRQTADDLKKQNRKSKPARLDISKLFPKPRSNGTDYTIGALLSPNKMVNSPSAMSTASEYFPRPMTREPTPIPNTRGHAKLTKATKRPQGSSSHATQRSTSPVRLYKRDTYDSAKVNVRRPPRGIEHWFDGLGEESDDNQEEEDTPKYPVVSAPVRKGSSTDSPSRHEPKPIHADKISKHELHVPSNPFFAHSLNSPAQMSIQSQTSLSSIKTKESAFSKSNLQDSSVLSMSSSEDEDDDVDEKHVMSRFRVRDSVETNDDHGEVIIGKAQAYEIRPRMTDRRTSDSKLSMRTTSTNAATIEVMYTPEPYTPQMFPRSHGTSSRRSSHMRQPSVIMEDEDVSPKNSAYRPMSPSASVASAYTAISEPRARTEGHKLMAVTEEEEALLEMMRKKRAAMAKHSFTEGYKTAILQDARQKTPPESKRYRTSGFLANETPAGSPARAVTISRSSMNAASPLLHPPPRGRPTQSSQDLNAATSTLRDSSSCDEATVRRFSRSPNAILAHRLSPPPEFSPIDLFPSPARTPTDTGIASLTTTDHPASLPSPITPGRRSGEADVDVKVACSEPSSSGDNDDVAVLETGVIDSSFGSIKPGRGAVDDWGKPNHFPIRTANSDGNVASNPNPDSQSFAPNDSNTNPQKESHDLTPLSALSSGKANTGNPKVPRKSRSAGLTVNTTASRNPSRSSSFYSARTNSPATGPLDRRTSKVISRGNSINSVKRDSVTVGSANTHSSVSEDVLAAWGSLGGWRG